MWAELCDYRLGRATGAIERLNLISNAGSAAMSEPGAFLADLMLSWIYYDLGDLERGKDHISRWAAVLEKYADPVSFNYIESCYSFYMGMANLKEHEQHSSRLRLDMMRSLMREMGPFHRRVTEFLCGLLEAEIGLVEGNPDEATKAFGRVREYKLERLHDIAIVFCNMPSKDVLARAYLRKGSTKKAIAELERLVSDDPNDRGRLLVRPVAHYQLAKLYESTGSTPKAIEQYRRFLALWKDADESFPEPRDALERISTLSLDRQ